MKAESPVLAGSPVTEFTLGHDTPGIDPHPVVSLDETTFVSRWSLTPEELEVVVRTRELFILHGKIKHRFLPVRPQVERPEYTLRVLKLTFPGGGSVVCHGLEVHEAGGTEAERIDYAAAEAAALLAPRMITPCHVALLAEDAKWLLKGGQTCATPEELRESLELRLKKALDLIEKRVEAHGADGSVFRADIVEMTPRQCAGAAAA